MNYVDKMNAVRTAKGLSIRKLSHICGLSELALKNILNKKSIPIVSSVEKICIALEMSLAILFCTSDETVLKNGCQNAVILNAFDRLSQETRSHLLWIADRLSGH